MLLSKPSFCPPGCFKLDFHGRSIWNAMLWTSERVCCISSIHMHICVSMHVCFKKGDHRTGIAKHLRKLLKCGRWLARLISSHVHKPAKIINGKSRTTRSTTAVNKMRFPCGKHAKHTGFPSCVAHTQSSSIIQRNDDALTLSNPSKLDDDNMMITLIMVMIMLTMTMMITTTMTTATTTMMLGCWWGWRWWGCFW